MYVSPEGNCPFEEWLRGLKDVEGRARIRKRLDRLESGNFGDRREVGGGVGELRLHIGPGYRIYFGQDGRTLVILLCGGDKGSQRKDVERAGACWRGYLASRGRK
jgi:putative addiction module killer protein